MVMNLLQKMLSVTLIIGVFGDVHPSGKKCNLSVELIKEIRSYTPKVRQIINECTKGKFKGFVYHELAKFVDKFRHRTPGSQDLDLGIKYMLSKLKSYDLDNVHGEEVTDIPNWKRGEESATLLQPYNKNLNMLGLAGSVGTSDNPDGITAEAIVVNSIHELDVVSEKVEGKIVVFNEEWKEYENTNVYRLHAGVLSATYGAVATLIRSVTPFSINSPHTGQLLYDEDIKYIPAAAITVEDAHLLRRLYDRGEKLVINLKMEARILPNTTSQNTIAEIVGSQEPKKVVIVSGHLDNWDVGQGALDDGGGAFISWVVLVLLKDLNLRSRRTIRSILWTAEEEYMIGGSAYAKQHKNDTEDFVLMMESDGGTFNPWGLKFAGSDKAACIIQEILKLLIPLRATRLVRTKDVDSEITIWGGTGVPLASLLVDDRKYFWFHHTEADTIDVLDSSTMDKCLAVWTVVSYVAADLSIEIHRN